MTAWTLSHRFDPAALPLADRHYSRKKVGSPQFVPPGRCLVLLSKNRQALWVTSWPFAEYCKNLWPGAWLNALFRNEGAGLASDLIRQAVAATRARWQPPDNGIVTLANPAKLPGVLVRGERVYGYCYLKAGWKHIGFTQGGLWIWQQLPEEMPPAVAPLGTQMELLP